MPGRKYDGPVSTVSSSTGALHCEIIPWRVRHAMNSCKEYDHLLSCAGYDAQLTHLQSEKKLVSSD